MNGFERHHHDSILFSYSCFDRMILAGGIPHFMHTERAGTIRWFVRKHWQVEDVSRAVFARISREYHEWVRQQAHELGLEIVVPEMDADREELVEPYFRQLGQRPGIAVVLKAREPERIAWHYAQGNQVGVDRRHVEHYYFYLNDHQCGRMFVRICPYFPFHIVVWLNGHNWLKCALAKENIAFQTHDNLFVACARPDRLQQLSDAFAPGDIVPPVQAWLARLLPVFTDEERRIFPHQLYMTQIEYCQNLIFKKQAALNRLFERLLDANRGLGRPDRLSTIFSRGRFRPDTRTSQTKVTMTRVRLPVISSSYQKTVLKQYAKENIGLRTESSCFQLKNLSIPKHIDNLPKVRQALHRANQRYLNVQQDILATFVDRGQLEKLRQPSVSSSGRRVPGLHLDDPRLLAVFQALLAFAYLVGKGLFRTKDLLPDVRIALANPDYTLNQLRYDLSKLRGKDLVTRLPGTQQYQLSPEGYRIGVLYLKLYHRLYAPLTSALKDPVPADHRILANRQTKLDRLYTAVTAALDRLTRHVGLAA